MTRYNPDIRVGLNEKEINQRYKENLVNHKINIYTKSIKQIITTNIFTLFNTINFTLAILVFIVGSYKNAFFLGVVFCNTMISIIQEISSKKVIDKLTILNETKVRVIRNGNIQIIDNDEIVLDDLIKLKLGNQLLVDSIIVDGSVEVNESLITGESNSILKNKGDMLLSGSFIISGSCTAKVEHIGESNYTSKISKDAKYLKEVHSVMKESLDKIIKVITIIIFPVFLLLFLNQYFIVGSEIKGAIINTVAGVISMIPEGLILLTSATLAVSVLRLGRKNVLIKQLYSVETLSRVNLICFDKTGTITEDEMKVNDVISLKNYNIEEIMNNICSNFDNVNYTMIALKKRFDKTGNWKLNEKTEFSSEKKFLEISFSKKGKYKLGAPEVLTKNLDLDSYYRMGRVLALVHDDVPIALIILKNKLRKNVEKTIEYFKNQGVKIKIISGDNPKTIMGLIKDFSIDGDIIDLNGVSDLDIKRVVDKYAVFGRVNPFQKKTIIKKLKENYVVAFVGDGVNDVLALKESDCSIALSKGSDAARNISDIVLMDSDFNKLPYVLKEGRRTVNNIERSASLFIVKTCYATLLSVLFIFLPMSYPFVPIQFTLTSCFTIGIPAFILALEPNDELLKDNFIMNIFAKAIPTALSIVFSVLLLSILNLFIKLTDVEVSTLAVIIIGIIGILHIYKISKPLNRIRSILVLILPILFVLSILLLHSIFDIVVPNTRMVLILIVFLAVAPFLIKFWSSIYDKYISKKIRKIFIKEV